MAPHIQSPQPAHEQPPQGAQTSPYPASLIQFTQLPDKIAFVDLVSAQVFNENRAAIRDINRELGVNLKGNCYDLNDRLSRVIDPDGRLVLPETVLSVGKQNADFNTVQAAIDSITDASPSKPYVVNIYPGTYEETLVLKPNIMLKSFLTLPVLPNGPYLSMVKIQPPSGQCFHCTEAGNYLFDGIYFSPSQNGAIGHAPGYESNCDLYFSNCIFYGTSTPLTFLAEGSLFNYNFQKCVIRAANRHAQLIYAEGPYVDRQIFKAVDCYIVGTINIYNTDISLFNLILTRSYMDGKLYTDESAAHIELYRSYWYNYAAPLLDLYATDESLIECSESTLNSGATPAPFSTHGGSNQPIVETQNCTYGFAKPASYEWSLYGAFNHFGDALILKVDRL